jgi:signal peptidase I
VGAPRQADLLRSVPRGPLGWALAIVAVLASGCVDPELIKERYVEAYRLVAGSMAPTIHAGDLILVNKAAYRSRDPARGELVVFDYPLDESRRFVKRIVAIGGDVVYVQGRRVYLGCRPPGPGCQAVDEPWARDDPGGASRGSFGPFHVPPGAYFVLGDNRDNSQDSRFWGFVKREKIHGKVVFVYWSWDEAEKRVRWEQLGPLRS